MKKVCRPNQKFAEVFLLHQKITTPADASADFYGMFDSRYAWRKGRMKSLSHIPSSLNIPLSMISSVLVHAHSDSYMFSRIGDAYSPVCSLSVLFIMYS